MGIQLNASAITNRELPTHQPPRDEKDQELKHNEQLVYDALCQSKSPQKAYDLLNDLHDAGLRAPMTIYRALKALIAKGRARKIESLNAFIAIEASRPDQDTAFLICKECMRVKEIALNDQKVTEIFSSLHISAANINIEAFVDCKQMDSAL